MTKASASVRKTLCILLSVLLIAAAGLFCMSVAVSGTDDAGEVSGSVAEEESSEPVSGEPVSEEPSSEEPSSEEPSSEEPSSEDPSSEEPSSEEQSSEEPSSEEPSSEEPPTEPPTEPSDGAVAEIYHCVSGPSLTYFFGHTWICIRNVSGATLYVGQQAIEPGQMISAGHHRGGFQFNKEMRQYANKTVTACKSRINADQFAAAAAEIMDPEWGTYELFAHNCTNFSTAVWRAATGQRMTPFIFPFVLRSQINSRSPVGLIMA